MFSLSKIFNEENINLTGMNVRVNKQGKATVSVKFEIRSKEQLNKLIAKIRNVEGIIDIERTTGWFINLQNGRGVERKLRNSMQTRSRSVQHAVVLNSRQRAVAH